MGERIEVGNWLVDPDEGHVYSAKSGKRLGSVGPKGYLRVGSTDAGDRSFVHRVVWESANGPVPEGLQINHVNGDKTDNRLVNLELVTGRENVRHAIETGLRNGTPFPAGDGHPRAKLTRAKVESIRALRASGVPRAKVALSFGISEARVSAITSRKAWA